MLIGIPLRLTFSDVSFILQFKNTQKISLYLPASTVAAIEVILSSYMIHSRELLEGV